MKLLFICMAFVLPAAAMEAPPWSVEEAIKQFKTYARETGCGICGSNEGDLTQEWFVFDRCQEKYTSCAAHPNCHELILPAIGQFAVAVRNRHANDLVAQSKDAARLRGALQFGCTQMFKFASIKVCCQVWGIEELTMFCSGIKHAYLND